MNRLVPFLAATVAGLMASALPGTQQSHKPRVRYVREHEEPVIKEIQKASRAGREQRRAETERIRDAQAAAEQKMRDERRKIRFDFTGVEKPESVDAFDSAFHFPPVSQFNTGNCWCFSTTSFFEAEVYRLTGQKIMLSEMYTVYHEFLEKARRYVRERGASFFDQGSEGNAVMLVWRSHGVVPAEAYRGTLDPDGRYDDEDMVADMKAYLEQIKKHELWDEELVLASLRLIMDKYMGRPPERIVDGGVEMTPQQFLADVLRLNLDDYVCVMSTLAQPFHEFGEYEVTANWWHSRDYYNVPLEEFYQIIKYAIQNGYSVRLNGDVTEPGHDGSEDAAIIPSFDIPRAYIDQDARELRFFSGATDDDHDVHLVGYTRVGDYDWFLVKDSSDAVSLGRFEGYIFYREDYIKLKTLTYIVHKDTVRAVVEGFEKP